MVEDNLNITDLTNELEKARQEADKWRTGAEIYEAQVTDLQEAMQELVVELDRLTLENQQLKAHPKLNPGTTGQELSALNDESAVIQRALISRVQQLEEELQQFGR